MPFSNLDKLFFSPDSSIHMLLYCIAQQFTPSDRCKCFYVYERSRLDTKMFLIYDFNFQTVSAIFDPHFLWYKAFKS